MINVLSTERLLIGQNGVEIFLLKSFQDALIDYPTAGRLLATANQSGKIALSFSHWIHQGIGELLWGNDHPSMIRGNDQRRFSFKFSLCGSSLTKDSICSL